MTKENRPQATRYDIPLAARPKAHGRANVTTPLAAQTIEMLGRSTHYEGVMLTHDEIKHINRVYGYTPEPDGDAHVFMQAAADLNAQRHMKLDGIRLMAWLARYVDEGEDPLKVLVCLAAESGYEIDPKEAEWAFGEDASPEDDSSEDNSGE